MLQTHAEVDDGIACQEAFDPRVLNALLDRRNVLPGDRASEDLVDELEVAPARERLHRDLAFGELSVTARLLLVPPMSLGQLGYRLAVRHLRRMENDVDVGFLVQLLDDDRDVA